jgi:hypothetical protein
MMRSNNWGAAAYVAALLFSLSNPARAEVHEAMSRFRLSASAGDEYDDNVSAPDIDTSSEQGASAGVFEVGGEAAAYKGKAFALDLGYDFFQSLYAEDDVDELDLQLHMPWLSVATAIEEIDLDFTWRSSFALLGNDRYLDTHALGQSVGFLVGDSLYLRSGYEYQFRSFKSSHPLVDEETNDRSAHRHSIRVDTTWLLPRFDLKLRAGFLYRAEDTTRNREFEYDAVGGGVGLGWKTPLPGIGYGPPEIDFRFRFDDRQYAGPSRRLVPDGSRRNDERVNLSVAVELPLRPLLFGRVTYEHLDSESNDPGADYRSNAFRMQIEARY